jgi:hypothetical protein
MQIPIKLKDHQMAHSYDETGRNDFVAAYSYCTKTSGEYAEELVEFQRHVIKLR